MTFLRNATRALVANTSAGKAGLPAPNAKIFESALQDERVRTQAPAKPITERSATGRIFPNRNFDSVEASGIEAAGWLASLTDKAGKNQD